MRTDLGINVDAFDLNEPWLAVRKHRTGDRTFALGSHNSDFDIPVEDARFILIGRADLNTLFTGNNRRADHVHIGVGAFHDTGHNCAIQGAQVHLRHLTVV